MTSEEMPIRRIRKVRVGWRITEEAHNRLINILNNMKGIAPSEGDLVSVILESLPETPSDIFVATTLSRLEEFPQLLQTILWYKYQDTIGKWKNRMPNEFWVSELVYCPYRVIMARNYRPLLESQIFFSPQLILGELAHLGLRFFANALGYDYETPVEIMWKVNIADVAPEFREMLTAEEGFSNIVLRGRVDVLDKKRKIIWDLKTGRDVKNPPSPHHALQVYIYKLITRAEEARILYITSSRMCEVRVTDDDVRGAIEQLGLKLYAFSDPKSFFDEYLKFWLGCQRTPLWNWECDYCVFRAVCPKYSQRRG